MNGRKTMLLPRMAVNNIRKNSATYFPYIGVSIFAMFTYFSFDLLLKSDVMETLPKAGYAMMLIGIGFGLLGIILVPFLYYTNSFLIKRRKKELGLYSILGMEKKHIGIMMLWESVIVYAVVAAAAVLLGILFSRLIFLVLLNLAKLPVDVHFGVSPRAVVDVLLFYAVVTGLNLFVNLVQVGKARPAQLLGESAKGERVPKHIRLWTVLGSLCLGLGYYLAVSASLNGFVFVAFFLAVLLVAEGTYFLFTSGSILLLQRLKKKKRYYYREEHFIAVSGMLYRMKKNAAGLSNICIFSTMVMITVICTVVVWLRTDSIIREVYPRDMEIVLDGEQDGAALKETYTRMAAEAGVELQDYCEQAYVPVEAYHDGECFRLPEGQERNDYANNVTIYLMTAEELNRVEGTDYALGKDEAVVFSSGRDIGEKQIGLGEGTFIVREERSASRAIKKVRENSYSTLLIVALCDEETVRTAAAAFGIDASTNYIREIGFTPVGEKAAVDQLSAAVSALAAQTDGYRSIRDNRESEEGMEGMYGGLLFVGIFYGMIFLVCLLIIMYYKQITEGFEDRRNFEIMQKVGMSDEEIRRTIKKQVLLVFALPLAGAVLHTAVGMKMVVVLFAAINCFGIGVMIACTAAVCVVFGIFYVICYKRTSGAYYRIVRGL